MRKLSYSVSVLLFFGIFAVTWFASQTFAQPPVNTPATGGLPACTNALNVCNSDLNSCVEDLAECEAQPHVVFPGDGYPSLDSFGVSGHGPELHYTDNPDGTFTDDNSGLMWEKKLAADGSEGGDCNSATQANRSAHCVNNTYRWTAGSTAADGPLFMEFLDALNTTCNGDGFDDCETNDDCMGIGNEVCGLAGHTDWHIPNAKELQSILDYSKYNPFWSAPGAVTSSSSSFYWSATTHPVNSLSAWYVQFGFGNIGATNKLSNFNARAVRTP